MQIDQHSRGSEFRDNLLVDRIENRSPRSFQVKVSVRAVEQKGKVAYYPRRRSCTFDGVVVLQKEDDFGLEGARGGICTKIAPKGIGAKFFKNRLQSGACQYFSQRSLSGCDTTTYFDPRSATHALSVLRSLLFFRRHRSGTRPML